jgi:poly(hydroxyalkanoate) granule-associated protein
MAAKKKGKLGGAGAAKKDDPNLLYSAHQIWLAGLGALARAQAGAPKVFDELMREGSKLQGGALDAAQKVVMQAFQGAQKTVNERVDTVKTQAGETWDNLEKIFQSRVQRAMHQLGMPTAEEITALTRKVEELSASVERLARTGAAPAKRAPRRRPPRGGAQPQG